MRLENYDSLTTSTNAAAEASSKASMAKGNSDK